MNLLAGIILLGVISVVIYIVVSGFYKAANEKCEAFKEVEAYADSINLASFKADIQDMLLLACEGPAGAIRKMLDEMEGK